MKTKLNLVLFSAVIILSFSCQQHSSASNLQDEKKPDQNLKNVSAPNSSTDTLAANQHKKTAMPNCCKGAPSRFRINVKGFNQQKS